MLCTRFFKCISCRLLHHKKHLKVVPASPFVSRIYFIGLGQGQVRYSTLSIQKKLNFKIAEKVAVHKRVLLVFTSEDDTGYARIHHAIMEPAK